MEATLEEDLRQHENVHRSTCNGQKHLAVFRNLKYSMMGAIKLGMSSGVGKSRVDF